MLKLTDQELEATIYDIEAGIECYYNKQNHTIFTNIELDIIYSSSEVEEMIAQKDERIIPYLDFEKNPDNYSFLSRMPSSDSYRLMETFINYHVNDEALQRKLQRAIDQKKPFRRFKDTLINNSDQLMRAWSKFEMNKKIDALKFQIQLIIDANED